MVIIPFKYSYLHIYIYIHLPMVGLTFIGTLTHIMWVKQQ